MSGYEINEKDIIGMPVGDFLQRALSRRSRGIEMTPGVTFIIRISGANYNVS